MKRKLLFLLFTVAFLFNKPFAQNVGIGIDTPQAKLHVNGTFKLKNGVIANAISADSNFAAGSDSILPTQKAIKRYIQKGNWLSPGNGPAPAILDSVATNLVNPVAVFVLGNYAYVASNSNDRLCIYDIGDPGNIIEKGSTVANLDGPNSVYVRGNYAYVASWNNHRLCIYDISDPLNIIAKGFTSTNLNGSSSVYVQGNYAYVASWNNDRLCIYDISDPNNIVARGFTAANLERASCVFVRGNYAYVTSGFNSRLCIYDISDPNNIVAKGFTSTNLDIPRSVFVAGNYAYVASQLGSGVGIFDISDPNNIVYRGTASAPFAFSVHVQGKYAYVATWQDSHLYIFDVSDPGNIVTKGSASLAFSSAVFAQGNYVYATTYTGNKLYSYFFTEAGTVSRDGSGNVIVDPPVWQSNGNNIARTYGNVGIGTTSPVNKLDVRGAAVIGTSYSGANVAPVNGLLVQGFVGVGTTNPTVPLEVGTQTTVGSIGTYGYLNPAAAVGTASATNIPVSIKASARILSIEFNAYSDQRIKKNIISSSSRNDLATLLKIRVADYQLKDSVFHGNRKIKGFIAQELENVMPQAVHTNTDFVPDIYCLSTSTEYNEKEKTLKVSLCKPHDLKVGDKVKVFAGDGMQEQYVSAINSNGEFTLSNWDIKQAGMNPVSKVFVWGKQVTDFHTVDYNQVFSLGISAIQQLAKENDELKTKTESLQQQIDELKKMILRK